MSLNVQVIGKQGSKKQLTSNNQYSYFVLDYNFPGSPSGSHNFTPKLAAGENDPSAGNSVIVLTDLFTPVLFSVIDYDCRFWVSNSSAPGTLILSAQYSDGGALPTQTIDSDPWTNGCDSVNGARITGASKNVLSALRNDGSKWGVVAISAARGGSVPTPCAGNYARAAVLIRVDTPKIITVEDYISGNDKITVKKL